MKKFLHLGLALCMVFIFVFAISATAWADTEGIFTYEVNNGKVTITECDKNAKGSIAIPDTLGGCPVTIIGESAFDGCNNIIELTIPDSVEIVEDFSWCENLNTLNIGAGVQLFSVMKFYSGEGEFYEYLGVNECPALRNINVSEDNEAFSDIDGVLFNKDKTELMAYPDGRIDSVYNIPDGVTDVNLCAFNGCGCLLEINIPESLTEISGNDFSCCSSLQKFIVNKANSEYTAVDGILYNKDKTILARYPAGRTETVFNIPDNVVEIGEGAFSRCNNLTEINIPDSVTSIGHGAFRYSSSLKEIIIPDGVQSINRMLCFRCESLTYVSIGTGVRNIEDSAFAGCKNLTTVAIPQNVVEIPVYSMNNYNHPFGGCDKEKLFWLVQKDSYAQQYAIDNNINYRLGFMVNVAKEHGTVKGAGLCDKYAETTLTAAPDNGYKFSGWYAGDTLLSNANPYKFAVENDMDITAKFEKTQSGGGSSGGSGGGGGGGSVPAPTTNTISVPNNVTGGTVSVNPVKAAKGDTVTVTAKADDGKKLDKLTVSAGGKEIALKDLGDGKYSFTMPDGKVSVDAVFVDGQTVAISFKDVSKDSYYYDAVQWAVTKGIAQGTSSDTFSPGTACTRAQMVTFLWRAAGSPEPQNENNGFADVGGNAYYAKAVQWAVEQGITKGADSNTFSPDTIVNRSQVVTFLWRAAGSPAVNADAAFNDVPASVYYNDAVRWAVENNITTGVTVNSFAPAANCSRAEIATFMYRNQ